jgi:hypothetical protein
MVRRENGETNMNTEATTELHTSITLEAKGYRGRLAQYRVAVATRPELLTINAATVEGRAAVASGELVVERIKGSKGAAESAAQRIRLRMGA